MQRKLNNHIKAKLFIGITFYDVILHYTSVSLNYCADGPSSKAVYIILSGIIMCPMTDAEQVLFSYGLGMERVNKISQHKLCHWL